MSALKIARPPAARIWRDPLPRITWEYRQGGRWRWYGDYGPLGIRHEFGYGAFTERGIRRKLARLIRAERRRRWQAYATKKQSDRGAA